jgi:hypothetical protein
MRRGISGTGIFVKILSLKAVSLIDSITGTAYKSNISKGELQMSNRFDFRPNETVHCRFAPYEALVVISCNGCIAVVRNPENGETYPIGVGCITRRPSEGAAA